MLRLEICDKGVGIRMDKQKNLDKTVSLQVKPSYKAKIGKLTRQTVSHYKKAVLSILVII